MARRSRKQNSNVSALRASASDLGWQRVLAGVLLIAGAVLAAYWPSLRGDFVLDDEILVSQNNLVRAPDGLLRFWFSTEPADYWPVTNSTFWLEWRAWLDNPTGYRASNIVLHIADSLLIWLILRRLAIPGAFLAALLFAVHPVNVESVAWIAQRKNVLSLLFFLLSIWLYLRSQPTSVSLGSERGQTAGNRQIGEKSFSASWYWLGVIAFVLAALSKGSVAILPLVLLLISWWQNGRVSKRDLLMTAPFFVIAVVLTLVNIWFQRHGSEEIIRQVTPAQRLAGAGAVVWFYLWKALVPLRLAFVYSQWEIDPSDLRWWLPLAATLAVTALLIRQRHTLFGRPLLFAWAFFCIALLPVMGFTDVGFMKYSLVADHYQHIALIAVVALAAAAIVQAARIWHGEMWRDRSVAIAAGIPVGILCFLTFRQADLYGDPVRLYEATLALNPKCWMAENNLGQIFANAGKTQDAIDHYRRSLAINNENPGCHVNLGLALAKLGQPQAAMDEYHEALRIKKDYTPALNDLGIALAAAGKEIEAAEMYMEALRIQHDNAAVHFNWGSLLARQGRLDDAISHFKAAVVSDPYYSEAYLGLANALFALGDNEDEENNPKLTREAIRYYEKAAQLRPSDPESHYNFALALAKVHRLSDAIAQCEEFLRLAPNRYDAENALGAALAWSGRFAEAVPHIERALKLNPQYAQAYYNLAMAHARLGHRVEARSSAQKALELAKSQGDSGLAAEVRSWLDSFTSDQR